MTVFSPEAKRYDSRMARPRIQADLPEEVRRGLIIAAAEQDVSIGELIERMAREKFPAHIERAKELIAKQGKKPPPPKPAK
jgi:hypothetical protein